jgi:hypothetical protein
MPVNRGSLYVWIEVGGIIGDMRTASRFLATCPQFATHNLDCAAVKM